jgi:hypothetical protein
LGQLRRKEEELAEEVASHTASLEEIGTLESALSEALLRLEAARKSVEMAHRDREIRKGFIDAVAEAEKEHQGVEESVVMSQSALSQADKEIENAQTAYNEADRKRREADALTDLRRADFDYYNDKLHLDQLRERKGRIDQARKNAEHAENVLAQNKVDNRALEVIQDAERAFLTAKAQLEIGAPSVLLRGLADCQLLVDDVETILGVGEVRNISVADRSKITVPGMFDVEITPGSSTEELSRKMEEARQVLDKECADTGVANPDEALKAFEERREALRHLETTEQVESENLRDLSYEELERKVHHLQKRVPDYVAKRMPEPAICLDLDSAKKEWQSIEAAQQKANSEWEVTREAHDAARSIREGVNTKYQEARIQLDLLAKGLRHARESLEKARKDVPDEVLEHKLAEAVRLMAAEKADVKSTEESLKAKNPERVKALTETAKGSLQTVQTRRNVAQTELTEVQTRLKIHGEEGLHEKLHMAKSRLERLSHETQSLFRRATIAKLLFESMRDERDKARRAYVAPLKNRIAGLGRLVFDDTFQVDINDDLQIVNSTLKDITVPFDSLSGGTKEQLSLMFRLACSMIVAADGGTPVILDDALGYTDPERLRLMGTVFAKAAKECQIVIFTCTPNRYSNVGEATIVVLH